MAGRTKTGRRRKPPPPQNGRWPLGRLLLGASGLFVVGVAMGTGLGLWLGGVPERPQTTLAMPERPDLDERRYDLPVTVFRSERALGSIVYEEAPPEPPEDARTTASAPPPPVVEETALPHAAAPAARESGPERAAADPKGAETRRYPAPAAPDLPDPLVSDPGSSDTGSSDPGTSDSETREPGWAAIQLARVRPGLPDDALRAPEEPLWRKHAVPIVRDPTRPMIAVVIDDLGIDQPRTRRTLSLAGPLTLAFLPYGYNLSEHVQQGRARGHEILLHLPMEPMNPIIDPGPNALMTDHGPEELQRRLDWALSQFGDYVGVNNHMGSRFTAWPEGMQQFLAALNRRGLLFLDSITTRDTVGFRMARAMALPHATRDVFLDHDPSAEAIAWHLRRTEEVARAQGVAVAVGHPYDSTLSVLEEWLADIEERGFQLVPISTVVAETIPEG